ncbi:MAG: efflux RND transporter periplasmic adaptor subunit [Bacteroidales bacterium]|nr:efflux RND transporter periplasmic adaptor subunit [Bacteroidales bacterium]
MKILVRTLVYAGLACAGMACKPASSGKSAEKGYEAHVHSHEAHDHAHDHNHDHAGHDYGGHNHDRDAYSHGSAVSVPEGNTIVFSKALQQKVPFSIETVHYETFGPVIKTVAYVEPSPNDEVKVIAKADGVVIYPSKPFIDGSEVRAGQQVLSIGGGGLADNNMQVRFNEAYNRYRLAKAEYDRKEPLREDKIVSEKEWMRVSTEYSNAKTEYEYLRENFSKREQMVKAPMSGFIRELSVRNGEYVKAGQTLMVISQNRRSFLRAEVSPRRYADLKNIETAVFREKNGSKVYTLDDLNGHLVSFGRSATLESPLLPVVFEIDAVESWIPGSFVDVYIRAVGDREVLTVSNTAIVEEMGSYFVFVRLSDELFEKRQIEKGHTDGMRTEVRAGLQAGEQIVGLGAISVKLAQSSGALDPHAGHAH